MFWTTLVQSRCHEIKDYPSNCLFDGQFDLFFLELTMRVKKKIKASWKRVKAENQSVVV